MLGVVIDSDTTVAVSLSALATAIGILWRVIKLRDRWRDESARQSADMADLKRKVGIMWGFQTRRGVTEAENSGVVDPRQGFGGLPIMGAHGILPARVRQHFAGLQGELRAFCREFGQGMDDDELKLEIEGRFGPRIALEVCKPLRWHEGACLHAAAIIARESDTEEVHAPA